jgi:polysaccharide biosynthesis transport protein
MRGGRRKLPVLAEIAGPAPSEARAWSLRRADLEALAEPREALEGRRVALVTGEQALPGATAIAAAAGASGRRAVLLECDLARPRLAAQLGLAAAPGLHEYLRWEATAPEILQPLVMSGPAAREAPGPLVCIAAGRPAAYPGILIALESFRHALAKLRAAYDLVVLAGPSPDAGCGSLEALAAQADVLLAAVAPGALAGRPGRELRAALRRLPVKTGGAILVGEAQRS